MIFWSSATCFTVSFLTLAPHAQTPISDLLLKLWELPKLQAIMYCFSSPYKEVSFGLAQKFYSPCKSNGLWLRLVFFVPWSANQVCLNSLWFTLGLLCVELNCVSLKDMHLAYLIFWYSSSSLCGEACYEQVESGTRYIKIGTARCGSWRARTAIKSSYN